jgi:predicted ArsR family transcriptional regulator
MIPRQDDDISAIRLLDEPVRRRLYDWVVAQDRSVGRDEAASAVGVGRALAAFHLDRLVRAGLLSAGYRRLNNRRGPGAGRPARVYSRGEREIHVSLPERQYERVADVFAAALEHLGGPEPGAPLVDAARRAGAAAVPGADAQVPAPAAEPGRIRLLSALRTSGYEPFTDEDGTIRLRNCPFHALVEQHRGLVCGANLAMAEGMTEAAGARAAVEPVLDPRPGLCCVAFRPPESA